MIGLRTGGYAISDRFQVIEQLEFAVLDRFEHCGTGGMCNTEQIRTPWNRWNVQYCTGWDIMGQVDCAILDKSGRAEQGEFWTWWDLMEPWRYVCISVHGTMEVCLYLSRWNHGDMFISQCMEPTSSMPPFL